MLFITFATILTLGSLSPAQSVPASAPASRPEASLFDAVVARLKEQFKEEVTSGALDALVTKHRAQFDATSPLTSQRIAIHNMLAEIPSSHVALVSDYAARILDAELNTLDEPTTGIFLTQHPDGLFISRVLAGSPAARAGFVRGERIITIDGAPTAESPRLDWRCDDAFLDDPPSHLLRCKAAEAIAFTLERSPGVLRKEIIKTEIYSSFRSDLSSIRVVEQEGKRLGILPISFFYRKNFRELLASALNSGIVTCDGLLLDTRGRGGSSESVGQLLAWLDIEKGTWKKPTVALADHTSRSAKEIFLSRFRDEKRGLIVGEKTTGAVRSMSILTVGHESVLLCTKGRFKEPGILNLEGVGVAPDILVADVWPWTDQRDPIFEAGLVALIRECSRPEPALSRPAPSAR